jgi:hypothetical protein
MLTTTPKRNLAWKSLTSSPFAEHAREAATARQKTTVDGVGGSAGG